MAETQSAMHIDCLIHHPHQLAEGPLWDAEAGRLLWVDILARTLHCAGADGSQHDQQLIPEGVTSVSLTDSGHYLCTSEQGFLLLDKSLSLLRHSGVLETSESHSRFNDAKVDPAGRLWAGSMNRNLRYPTGLLFQLNGSLDCSIQDSGYIVCNGPTFSRDGSSLMQTDTIRRVIYRFDLSEDGKIHNKREFARLEESEGLPDGMTTDAEDCLWVCSYAGSRLTRFSPKGERLMKIEIPVSNIASCTFGGEDYRSLFVTTATSGLSATQLDREPLAGSIFRIDCGVEGLPPNLFRLDPGALSKWSQCAAH